MRTSRPIDQSVLHDDEDEDRIAYLEAEDQDIVDIREETIFSPPLTFLSKTYRTATELSLSFQDFKDYVMKVVPESVSADAEEMVDYIHDCLQSGDMSQLSDGFLTLLDIYESDEPLNMDEFALIKPPDDTDPQDWFGESAAKAFTDDIERQMREYLCEINEPRPRGSYIVSDTYALERQCIDDEYLEFEANDRRHDPPFVQALIRGLQPCGILLSTEFKQIKQSAEWSTFLNDTGVLMPSRLIPRDENYDSHARHRPRYKDGMAMYSVYIVYKSGHRLDIGVHPYLLATDVLIPFKASNLSECVHTAYSEFTASWGGISMAVPTPSHYSHQCASACLSALISNDCEPIVEPEKITGDLSVKVPGFNHPLVFDFTSSAGVHAKHCHQPTVRSKNAKSKDLLIIISKYDVLHAIINMACRSRPHLSKSVSTIVASSLVVEYPDAYKRITENSLSTKDLQLQNKIYQRYSMMSEKTQKKLAEMSFNAVCSLNGEIPMDFPLEQGVSWKEKRDIFINALNNLQPRNKGIAIPPFPMVEISALPPMPRGLRIAGRHFSVPVVNAGPDFMRINFNMDHHDLKLFRHDYPVNGIVPHEEAREIADLVDSRYMQLSGLSHRGPVQADANEPDKIHGTVDDWYSYNPFCQLAEIQADVARAHYRQPIPKAGDWNATYVYANKVLVFYCYTGQPSGPEGGVIDWFAVSGFKVFGSQLLTDADAVGLPAGSTLYLWPRQRMRTQEMDLAIMNPSRLKGTLYSMLEKAPSCVSESREHKGELVETLVFDVYKAFNRLALVSVSSTWASGELFLTARYLSATLGAPSSPWHKMADKLIAPLTFADTWYLERLRKVITDMASREAYETVCPILGLPRHYSGLESYLVLWVPNKFANSDANMAKCVMALCKEAMALRDSYEFRLADLQHQYDLLNKDVVSTEDLKDSLRRSCLVTADTVGWSFVGSLAAAHALAERAKPQQFDKDLSFDKGNDSFNLEKIMTVRHSFHRSAGGVITRGTVAEMIIRAGMDEYMSMGPHWHRFLVVNDPYFMNHPKSGEHKVREISIADPDSRIALSIAEFICGKYGFNTRIDYLKKRTKNGIFYRNSEVALSNHGMIQSSDATRYGPNMSNCAIAMMCRALASHGSSYFKFAAATYARLSYRIMLIPMDIMPELELRVRYTDISADVSETMRWVSNMPSLARENLTVYKGYTTSHHMGQGMSHHSSSLLHAGGILTALHVLTARTYTWMDANRVMYHLRIDIEPMVTSDDSTIIIHAHCDTYVPARVKFDLCREVLRVFRLMRPVCLHMVSVKPNLVKEIISGTKGEFNSQDTGKGAACPLLGFRELISLLVYPSAPSLIGDYISAHANARNIAFAGQGLRTGVFIHRLFLNMIEARWRITKDEREKLLQNELVPVFLCRTMTPSELLSEVGVGLTDVSRSFLYSICKAHHIESDNLDPHTMDGVMGPLMYVKVSMPAQHKRAITAVRQLKSRAERCGQVLQAEVIDRILHETLSSARTRNLGRIASRIAFRTIKLEPYLKGWREYPSMTLKDATFYHLQYLRSVAASYNMTQEELTSSSAANIMVVMRDKSQTSRFILSHPPRLTRTECFTAIKPRVRQTEYGQTPWGRHVVMFTNTTVVEEYSEEHRNALMRYMLMRTYTHISEHVTYRGAFVVDYLTMAVCTLKIFQPLTSFDDRIATSFVGLFDDESLNFLRTLQHQNYGFNAGPTVPVLAFHNHYNGKSKYVGMHGSVLHQITVTEILPQPMSSREHTDEFQRRPVILACQKYVPGATFDPGMLLPSDEEVQFYILQGRTIKQNLVYPTAAKFKPDIEQAALKQQGVHVPPAATIVEREGKKHLYYVNYPRVKIKPSLPEHIKQTYRAKVITALNVSRYWNSSEHGVRFRSFLRGAYYEDTCWIGAALGENIADQGLVQFATRPESDIPVNTIVVLGGYDDHTVLERFEATPGWSGAAVFSNNQRIVLQDIIPVAEHLLPTICALNLGYQFPPGMRQDYHYVNVPVFPERDRIKDMDLTREQLIQVLRGGTPDDDDEPDENLA